MSRYNSFVMPFQGTVARPVECRTPAGLCELTVGHAAAACAPERTQACVTYVPNGTVMVQTPDDVINYVAARVPARPGCATAFLPLHSFLVHAVAGDEVELVLPPKRPLWQGFVLLRAVGSGRVVRVGGCAQLDGLEMLDDTIRGPAFLFVPPAATLKVRRTSPAATDVLFAVVDDVPRPREGESAAQNVVLDCKTLREIDTKAEAALAYCDSNGRGLAAVLAHSYALRPTTVDDLVGADARFARRLMEREGSAVRLTECMVVEYAWRGVMDAHDLLTIDIDNGDVQTYDVRLRTMGELFRFAGGFATQRCYKLWPGHGGECTVNGFLMLFVPQVCWKPPTPQTMPPTVARFMRRNARELLTTALASAPSDAHDLYALLADEMEKFGAMMAVREDGRPATPTVPEFVRGASRKRPLAWSEAVGADDEEADEEVPAMPVKAERPRRRRDWPKGCATDSSEEED